MTQDLRGTELYPGSDEIEYADIGQLGGHALVLMGVETDPRAKRKYLIFMNSWGSTDSKLRLPMDEVLRISSAQALFTSGDRARLKLETEDYLK